MTAHPKNAFNTGVNYTASPRITLITTGGTIEKTYDERTGTLANRKPVVRTMLAKLRLPGLRIIVRNLIAKDSLDMTDAERCLIVEKARKAARRRPVVLLHGTDTMMETAALLSACRSALPHPIVMTGAMRPYMCDQSDGLQNLTEAVWAARHLASGMWLSMHGELLPLPDIRKDRRTMRFRRTISSVPSRPSCPKYL